MSTLTEVRIILMGKTGNGKSSTGNSLLRKNAFKQKMSPNAVTEQCGVKLGIGISTSVVYTIVDTPGLLDTSKSICERALEIQRSVEICPEPHAFLIVFDATNRMTTDERFTIDMLRIVFGEKVFDHTIVVFTHGGGFESDEKFKHFWTENEHFVKLIELCGNRVTRIENSTGVFDKNEGAESILKMIKEISDTGNGSYNYKYLKIHKQVIEEHAKSYSGNGNVHEEISEIVKKISKKLDNKIWKKMMYGGLVVGASTMGGAGLGYLAGSATTEALVASALGATVISNARAIARAAFSTAIRMKFW